MTASCRFGTDIVRASSARRSADARQSVIVESASGAGGVIAARPSLQPRGTVTRCCKRRLPTQSIRRCSPRRSTSRDFVRSRSSIPFRWCVPFLPCQRRDPPRRLSKANPEARLRLVGHWDAAASGWRTVRSKAGAESCTCLIARKSGLKAGQWRRADDVFDGYDGAIANAAGRAGTGLPRSDGPGRPRHPAITESGLHSRSFAGMASFVPNGTGLIIAELNAAILARSPMPLAREARRSG